MKAKKWFLPALVASITGTSLLLGTGCETSAEGQTIKDVNIEQAQELLKKHAKTIKILDVRTPKEFEDGHLQGAVNLNFHAGEFETKLAQLDKNQKYLVYCQSGSRSKKVLKLMKKLGFQEAYHLSGDYSGWQGKGLPTVK